MVSSSYVRAAIDDALRDHMKALFVHTYSLVKRGDVDAARAAFRADLSAALQSHSEMSAIAKEHFGE